ncbi:Surfactin synthase subunit 2 [Candidatus Magnetaquicoccaceae bacterium FCR-1]|uniref:Surfactin synthase subunit 2 n=1 Tax=Candidatus Magnetaquiglobus chichijimensis TaxID=3141448 RepID=A0ABQ0C6F2_9PROT
MNSPSPINIAIGFHQSALRRGDHLALCVGGTTFRYAAILERVLALASAIEAHDPDPEQPTVGMFGYRSATAYAAVLAILYAGKGYVPLNPHFPVARNLRIADLSGIGMLILDGRCAEGAQELLEQMPRPLTVLMPDHAVLPEWTANQSRHRFISQSELAVVPRTIREPKSPNHGIAYLLFTSGSTGIPKGVMVSQENVQAFVEGMIERYRPTPEDRFSQHSDMTFDASVYDQFVCWAAGATLYPVPEEQRMAPAKFIQEHGITFWESVPAVIDFMRRMHLLRPGAFPSLRWTVFGGERLGREAARRWQVAAPNAVIDNSYGPTEGTICVTGYLWRGDVSDGECLNDIVPIGLPYPGQMAALLVDDRLIANEDGARGELCLAGSQVTPGYWRNPVETEKSYREMSGPDGMVRRWYRTGDLVEWRDGVGYHYLDRVDRQLKIRGYRVELSEIEHVLRQVAGSEQVAVIGWPPRGGNVTSVVGFVSGSKVADEEILAEMARRLPPYMVPKQLQRLSQLPLNANNKVDLPRLVELVEGMTGG